MFWDTGKKHYHDKMAFYELLAQVNGQGGYSNAKEVRSKAGGASSSSTAIYLTD